MKKIVKGSLFVALYLVFTFIIDLIVSLGAVLVGVFESSYGLNLSEGADRAALSESIEFWLTSHAVEIRLVSAVLLFLALYLVLKIRKIPLRSRLGYGKFGFRNALGTWLFLIGIGVGVSVILTLPALAPFMSEHKELMNSITAGNPYWVFLSVGVVGPMIEEFTFRGMIYKEMRTFMPAWLSVFLSALLFGLWHGNIVQGTYTFFFGLCLAAAYEKTDSFWVPVLMHILFNTLNFVPPLFWDDGSALLSILPGIVAFLWGWKLLRKKAA